MLDLDPTVLFISLIFGAVGIGYFSYGKKRGLYFRVTGVLLMIYPYFVNGIFWTLILGTLLVALPFILDNFVPL